MQLIGQLFEAALARRGERVTIVGATSGDTGSAAMEAFRGLDAVSVFILYPHGRVSEVQRRQMTTVVEDNAHALALTGNFDDCQARVKDMFNDFAFRDRVRLAGVNSINWARVLAQVVYYFTAAVSLGAPHRAVSFCVPTGNFGDIFAGHIARAMGLPIEKLIVATNQNDILHRALSLGRLRARWRDAVDQPVDGYPGVLELRARAVRRLWPGRRRGGAADGGAEGRRLPHQPGRAGALRAEFASGRASEAETSAMIARARAGMGELLCPHSAVGVHVAQGFTGTTPLVTLATAHPAKFPDAVEAATGIRPPLPPRMADLYGPARTGDARRQRPRRHRGADRGGRLRVTVELHTLSNGLRIVVEPMPGLQSASVGLWVSAGGRHERAEQNGIAHFLEHMAFKGTARRSALQIAEEIEDVGGYINAYTSREVTAYYARVLKEDVPLAVDLIADIVLNPAFDPDRDRDRAWRDPAGDRAGRRHARRHHLRLAAGRGLSRPAAGPHDPRPRGARARLHPRRFRPVRGRALRAERADPVGRGRRRSEEILRLAEAAFGHLTAARARRSSPRPSRAARSAWSRTWNRRISRWRWRRRATGPTTSTPPRSTPRAGRRHVLAAVPGDPRAARPVLHDLRQVGAFDDTGMLTIYAGTSGEQIGDLVDLTLRSCGARPMT
jgi:threonine synthase